MELLDVVKQKPETIVVDDDSDKRKKLSSYCNNNTKTKGSAKSKLPSKEKMTYKCPSGDHMNVEDLYTSNLKHTKKLKKYKRK
eukprot:3998432-Ditylum_brightwellii.AAC.1